MSWNSTTSPDASAGAVAPSTPRHTDPEFDVAATAVRAFVLYSLMEFQSGHATTIRVVKRGAEFSISDDGRGHPLDKALEGTSYLRFIYTHFDYPFEMGRSAPIQLQGIGMSLVNALCSELVLTVHKPSVTLTITFKDAQVLESRRSQGEFTETGLSVQARLRAGLPSSEAGNGPLEAWLEGIVLAHPGLRLYFNGRQVQPGTGLDASGLATPDLRSPGP